MGLPLVMETRVGIQEVVPAPELPMGPAKTSAATNLSPTSPPPDPPEVSIPSALPRSPPACRSLSPSLSPLGADLRRWAILSRALGWCSLDRPTLPSKLQFPLGSATPEPCSLFLTHHWCFQGLHTPGATLSLSGLKMIINLVVLA